MIPLWCAFIGLFAFRLVRRHGWEYVPLVLAASAAWWHFGSQAPGALADGVLLTAVAGVHLLSRREVAADYWMSER